MGSGESLIGIFCWISGSFIWIPRTWLIFCYLSACTLEPVSFYERRTTLIVQAGERVYSQKSTTARIPRISYLGSAKECTLSLPSTTGVVYTLASERLFLSGRANKGLYILAWQVTWPSMSIKRAARNLSFQKNVHCICICCKRATLFELKTDGLVAMPMMSRTQLDRQMSNPGHFLLNPLYWITISYVNDIYS